MSTQVRSLALDEPSHAYAALDAAGDGVLVVEVDHLGATVSYASPGFAENFVQRRDAGGRPSCVELVDGHGDLASLLENPALVLPWHGTALVHGLDLQPRNAALVVRALPGGATALRVCCTFLELEDVRSDRLQPFGDDARAHRALVNRLSGVTTVVTADGTIVHQSEAMTEITRYTRAERLGRPMWEVVNPDDQTNVRAWLIQIAGSADGQVFDNEYRIRRRDGQWRWVHVKAANLLNDPIVHGIVLHVADCTERRVAQMLLSQAQESLQLAVEGARIGFWEYTPAGDRFVASGEYHRLRGVDRLDGPLSDGEFWSSLHPADIAATRLELAKVMDGSSEMWDSEYRLRAADATWVWVQQRGRVVARDASGAPVRLAGILFDIDRRKRAEVELRATDERFRLAAIASRGHIYEFDAATGAVTRWHGTAQLLGLAPEDLAPNAEAWYSRVHPEDRDYVRHHERWTVSSEGAFEAYYRVKHADGHYIDVWDRAVWAPTGDSGERRMLGTVFDVSGQRRVERLLANAESVARVGSWEFDTITRETRWSHETYVLHGVTPESYTPSQDTYARFLTEQGYELLAAHNAACIREGGSYELDLQIVPATGRKIWVRLVAVAETVDGVVRRLAGAVQDIDALKRRGIRLQRQSQWLTLALATNALTTWRWYPDTDDFVLDHRSEAYVADMPARQPLAEWLQWLAPDCRERLRAAMAATAATGSPVDVECRLERAGESRFIEIRAERVISPDGTALIGTLRDVTASLAAERYLRTQAEVLAHMSEGVCVVGPDNAIRLTNQAFDRMLAMEPGAAIGRLFDELIDLPEKIQAISDIEVARVDGSRFSAALASSPLVLHGEALRIIIVHDITDRKQLQEELLETANREQRRIGSDLHDGLGQELTGIALMLRGLEERAVRGATLAPADIGEIVGLVNQAIQSTRTLARGLSPVEIERGGLAYALRALVGRARDLYGLDVRFQARSAQPITLDAATKTHLYRIAQEALTNAARHARATRVVVRLRVQGRRVSLSIEDDGVGLGPSADAGMGLKIMHYRAAIVGATLKVSAVRPSGTRIYCTLEQPDTPRAVGQRTDGAGDGYGSPAGANPAKGM